MLGYALRRIALTLPLLFGLSLLSFVYVRLIPGDPVTAMLGVNSSPELVRQLTHKYGFDQPLVTQYLSWLSGVLHGDFGVSFRSQLPVAPIIAAHVPPTLQLTAGGLVVMTVLAIPAGVIAGLRPGSRLDTIVTSMTVFGLSMPAFWLGTLLVMYFALTLHLVPSQGYLPLFREPVTGLRLMLLPCVVLGIAISPYLARLTRTAVVDVVQQPFIPYAQAKGLRQRVIAVRYVLRNTWSSIVAAIGLTVGGLLSGSVVIESLFNYPGMGVLMVGSVNERDYAMIQALVLIYGVVFVVTNLVAELVQAVLDPRVRLT